MIKNNLMIDTLKEALNLATSQTSHDLSTSLKILLFISSKMSYKMEQESTCLKIFPSLKMADLEASPQS